MLATPDLADGQRRRCRLRQRHPGHRQASKGSALLIGGDNDAEAVEVALEENRAQRRAGAMLAPPYLEPKAPALRNRTRLRPDRRQHPWPRRWGISPRSAAPRSTPACPPRRAACWSNKAANILAAYGRRGFVFERRIDLETGGAWWRSLILRKALTQKAPRPAFAGLHPPKPTPPAVGCAARLRFRSPRAHSPAPREPRGGAFGGAATDREGDVGPAQAEVQLAVTHAVQLGLGGAQLQVGADPATARCY